MKSLDEKKKDRFLLLNRLYERTDQPGLQLLKLSDIGQDVGLDGLEPTPGRLKGGCAALTLQTQTTEHLRNRTDS